MSTMKPREIVKQLDKYIIGQEAAKRSVAIALRNRWRRMQLDKELRNEITASPGAARIGQSPNKEIEKHHPCPLFVRFLYNCIKVETPPTPAFSQGPCRRHPLPMDASRRSPPV